MAVVTVGWRDYYYYYYYYYFFFFFFFFFFFIHYAIAVPCFGTCCNGQPVSEGRPQQLP